MSKYDEYTSSILDTIEKHFYVSENLLEKENLLKFVTNNSNHQKIMTILMKANSSNNFDGEQHKRNYLLKLLKNIKI